MAAVNRPNALQDYRTPRDLVSAIRALLDVDIFWDAACTSENCLGRIGGYAVDAGVDALTRDWAELRDLTNGAFNMAVWCNPPWARAGEFAAKAAEARCYGIRTLLLCQAAIDSEWFAEHVERSATVIALRPRVPFLGNDNRPAFVDARGKALGINRPTMLCDFGGNAAFRTWRWR